MPEPTLESIEEKVEAVRSRVGQRMGKDGILPGDPALNAVVEALSEMLAYLRAREGK